MILIMSSGVHSTRAKNVRQDTSRQIGKEPFYQNFKFAKIKVKDRSNLESSNESKWSHTGLLFKRYSENLSKTEEPNKQNSDT